MPMGAGRFDNVYKRLDVELDRMLRIGVAKTTLDDIRKMLLAQRPNNQEDFTPPIVRPSVPTTPYAIAINRFEGYQHNKYTWGYVLEAWDDCNEDDRARLNELFQGNS